MSEAAVAPTQAASIPKLKKKPSAPKKPAAHPKYSEMIKAAIQSLKERGGSSRQAILKYIMKNYTVGTDEKVVNQHLKMALRQGVKNDSLKQSKGTGAAGSFRIGEKPVAKKSPVKKAVTKKSPAKPKVKKAVKPKSPSKKPAAAKKPKSPGKKSPPKKAAAKTSKPKTVKKALGSPEKAAGAKKAAKK